MAFVIYGAKETPINVGEMMIKCAHCCADCMTDIMVISKCYHLYWIPMFSFEKLASTTCQKCGMFRGGLYFNNKLISNYEEVKGKFRHPWFTYTGIGLFTIGLILVILANISHSQ